MRSNLRLLNGGNSGDGSGELDEFRFLEVLVLLSLSISRGCLMSLRFAAISTSRSSRFANASAVADSNDSKRVESFSVAKTRGCSALIEAWRVAC